MTAAPPTIFAPARRLAARRRIAQLQEQADPARFVIADRVEDTLERLAFLRHEPRRARVIGRRANRPSARLMPRPRRQEPNRPHRAPLLRPGLRPCKAMPSGS